MLIGTAGLSCLGSAAAAASTPAALYRALGTEPFWSLTADGRRLEFRAANAPGRPVVQRQPRLLTGADGARTMATRRITVRITAARCNDGMSDRLFPDTVEVRVDGRRFMGCGGDPLPPGNLAGTNWRVEAINGRVTPAVGDFTIAFTADRFSGRLGCNWFNLAYTREERRLVPAGPLAVTRMSCSEMGFEQAGLALLSRPAALVAEAGERLSLANEAGSMTLRRMH